MSDLTQPWVWYSLGLCLIACLLYAADAYMQREWRETCERLSARTSVDAGLVEDDEVAWLESIPVLEEDPS